MVVDKPNLQAVITAPVLQYLILALSYVKDIREIRRHRDIGEPLLQK